MYVILILEFHPIEFIFNVIKFIERGVEFENIDLNSMTWYMRGDKFLTDWDNDVNNWWVKNGPLTRLMSYELR